MKANGTCLIVFSLLSSRTLAASFGTPETEDVSSEAVVCMAVGAWANLTGLDEIMLAPVSADGAAGAVYAGQDSFHLEANAPVRVLVEGGALVNDEFSVNPVYNIDGTTGSFVTTTGDGHDADHMLAARVQLGRISRQRAGSYQGTVLLTVVAEAGSDGCGASSMSFTSEDGWMTMAFEDLYPAVGDGDYNDAVVRYNIQENYNSQRQLETVALTFDPLARGAGYNHALYLSLDGIIEKTKNAFATTPEAFAGDALISVTYTRADGTTRTFNNVDKSDNITLFNNTRDVLAGYANVFPNQDWVDARYTTTVNITLANPEINVLGERDYSSLFNYRPYLHVMNTNKDIDLYEINAHDGMISKDGYPFGLLVPGTWEWPVEYTRLDIAYPHFAEYRKWLSGKTTELSPEARYWYKYPANGDLVISAQ